MSVTFADALAALRARRGEPTTLAPARFGVRRAAWGDPPRAVLCDHRGALDLAAGDARWALSGRSATPLPDALDAAEAWLRARGVAMPGATA